ncbi:hypothetical protein [Tsuneonella sp. HG222]
MAKVRVVVLRTLNGGEFNPGDKREMDSADAARLERRGAVKVIGAKKAPKPRNKMAQPPENKGEQ